MTHRSRRAWPGLAFTTAASGGAMVWPSSAGAQAPGYDQTHAGWTARLRKHVRLVRGGQATQVAQAGLEADRAASKACLESLSAVTPATFTGMRRWTSTGR